MESRGKENEKTERKEKELIVANQSRVKVPLSLWCSAKLNCVRHGSPTAHTQNTERKD